MQNTRRLKYPFLRYRKVYKSTFLTTENNLKLLPKVIFLLYRKVYNTFLSPPDLLRKSKRLGLRKSSMTGDKKSSPKAIFLKERGQMTVEYSVMFVVLVAVIIAASSSVIGPAFNRFFNGVGNVIDNATTQMQTQASVSTMEGGTD